MNQLFGQSTDSVRNIESDLMPSAVPVRPLPVSGTEQAFFHLDVRRSLQLHKGLAITIAFLFALLAVAYFCVNAFVLKTWPSYEAQCVIYVQPAPARVLQSAQGEAARWPYDTNTYESYMQQQMMNVSREDVLINALHKLHGWQKPGEDDQIAALRLVRSISVERSNNAYQFTITGRARTSQMAADVTNALMAAYLDSAAKDQKNGDSERLAILQQERDRIQNLLEADRTEQQGLNKQLGIASVSSAIPDHYDADITQMREELVKARTEHDAAEAKFASMDAGKGPSSAAIDAEADQMIAADAGLVSMKQSLNLRRATLISQMANLTPTNPVYKQDDAELQKIDGDLDTMMKNLRAKAAAEIQLKLKSELQRAGGVEQQLNNQLRGMVGAAGSATPKMQRSSDLAADITRLQARYATIDEELHNVMLENRAPASVYPVTTAVPPLMRSKSGVVRNSFLIAFVGLFFAVLAAVARNKIDPKVYVAQDVELILGFAPMAQLPDFDQVSAGVVDEFLLRLTSSIEHARKQSNLRSCVFTGINQGNGVTTLVNRIRVMLEAMGRPTVLVDASGAAAAPDLPRKNAAAPHGLIPIERASRPTALLQQMEEETETEDEALVLTDTAPLAVSAETEYLARFVDCAIVVIESGRTTRRELRDAAATLQRLDVGAVGFVLNRVSLTKAEPAFRKSIEAIEKHLEAQAVARRAEAVKTPAPVAEPQTEAPAFDTDMRAHYEPELAAAAAAVARFAPHSHADSPACLPTPSMAAPSAEPVKILHTDLDETSETPMHVEAEADSVEEAAEPVASIHAQQVEGDFAARLAQHLAPYPSPAEPAEEMVESHEDVPAAAHEVAEVQDETPAPSYEVEEVLHEVPAETLEAADLHHEEPAAASTAAEQELETPVEAVGFATLLHEAHAEWVRQEAKEPEAEVHHESAAASFESAEAPSEVPAASVETVPVEDESIFTPRVYEERYIAPTFHVEPAPVAVDMDSAAHVATGDFETHTVEEAAVEEAAPIYAGEAEPENWNAPEHFAAVEAEAAEPIEASEVAPFAEPVHEAEVAPDSEVGEQVIAEEATPVLAEETTHLSSHEPVLADEIVEEVAEEAAPIAVHEPVAAEEPEPVVAEAAAAVPSEEPAVAAEAAASVEPEVQKKPIVPEPAPQVESPWWLNQTSPRRERVRPPVLWKPARVWMPQPSDVSTSPSPTSPDTDPKGTAGNGSSSHHDLPTATGTSDQNEEASETLTSRLSGLRNLLFVMGVKNPHGSDEGSVRSHSADPSFRSEGPAEVLYPDPKRMAASSNIGDASPKLVTAPPQFLPPQPVVIKVDREEGASASEPPARFAPRSSFDGMELLQPKRGQFKS